MDSNNAIPIGKSAKYFPGKRPHITTIYRWMQRGVRGVRLETFTVGMRRYTSQEAIDRFVQQTTAAAPHAEVAQHAALSKARLRQIEQAERELDEAGI